MKTMKKQGSLLGSKFRHLRKLTTRLLLTTTVLGGLSMQADAKLVTHEWETNHRGYSIELVPGTDENGVEAEYVAAGTVYDQETSAFAWHFMHLDIDGNVLHERTTWVSSAGNRMEFRVVDIAAQNDDAFWITVQVRGMGVTSGDFIYLAGVHKNGVDLPTNAAIAIVSNQLSHYNLYPTHSYFASNGSIYICGYAADGTSYPSQPNNFYSNKYGMLLKCDVATRGIAAQFWDSYTDLFERITDYDMALRVVPNSYENEFPLLVTGAATMYEDEWLSSALVASFNADCSIDRMNGVIPLNYMLAYLNPRPAGVYGIDVRGGVTGGAEPGRDADVAVLINYFDDGIVSETGANEPKKKSYGLLRVTNTLGAYPGGVKSYMGVNSQYNVWAKQFMELHGYGNIPYYRDHHIPVIGEMIAYHTNGDDFCTTSPPAGALAPSLTNVNPFYSMLSIGSGMFDHTSGFQFWALQSIAQNKVYLSSVGTKASTMDYANGWLGYGAALEDMTRLYTFTSLKRHYDNPNVPNPPEPYPAMVVPVGKTNEAFLKTKYLKLTAGAYGYDEPSCRKQVRNCSGYLSSEVLNVSYFDYSIVYELSAYNAYTLFTPINQMNLIPSVTDCSTGYYKPTGVAAVNKTDNITMYPNPVSTELNLNIGTGAGSHYSFQLMDIAGKVVYQQQGKTGIVKVHLPELTSGVYVATVVTDSKTQTQKITIK